MTDNLEEKTQENEGIVPEGVGAMVGFLSGTGLGLYEGYKSVRRALENDGSTPYRMAYVAAIGAMSAARTAAFGLTGMILGYFATKKVISKKK